MVWSSSPTTHRSCRIAEPQLEEPLLERVRVLVLVHAEPRLACADDGDAAASSVSSRDDGLEQQVVEVDPAQRASFARS
jgi:hypothetical protein